MVTTLFIIVLKRKILTLITNTLMYGFIINKELSKSDILVDNKQTISRRSKFFLLIVQLLLVTKGEFLPIHNSNRILRCLLILHSQHYYPTSLQASKAQYAIIALAFDG